MGVRIMDNDNGVDNLRVMEVIKVVRKVDNLRVMELIKVVRNMVHKVVIPVMVDKGSSNVVRARVATSSFSKLAHGKLTNLAKRASGGGHWTSSIG